MRFARESGRSRIEHTTARIDTRGQSPVLVSALEARPTLSSPELATGAPAGDLLRDDDGTAGFLVAFPSERGVRLSLIDASDGSVLTESRIDAIQSADVAFSGTEIRPDSRSLAVAYSAQVNGRRAATARGTRGRGSPSPHISMRAEPFIFDTEGVVRLGPSISYAPRGFAESPLGDRGGWLLVWGTQHELKGVRVAQAGPQALGSPVVLATARFDQLFTFTKQTRTSRRCTTAIWRTAHYTFARANCEMDD